VRGPNTKEDMMITRRIQNLLGQMVALNQIKYHVQCDLTRVTDELYEMLPELAGENKLYAVKILVMHRTAHRLERDTVAECYQDVMKILKDKENSKNNQNRKNRTHKDIFGPSKD